MSAARRALRPFAEAAARGVVAARTRHWQPVSRLFVVGDRGGWSIDDDAVQVAEIARRLGYEVAPSSWASHARSQAVFLPSHFSALRPRWLDSSHRLGLAYFHGRPGTAGHPEFDEVLDTLRRHAGRIDRVQVTGAEMHDLVVSAGVDPGKVFRIPIGIDVDRFPLGDAESRRASRAALGLAEHAFVVGSFQKDGVGWGDGLEPKLVKGPDALVGPLDRLGLHPVAPPDAVLLERADDERVLGEAEGGPARPPGRGVGDGKRSTSIRSECETHGPGSTPAETTSSCISACVTWTRSTRPACRCSAAIASSNSECPAVPGRPWKYAKPRRWDESSQRGRSALKWLGRKTAWRRACGAQAAGATSTSSRRAITATWTASSSIDQPPLSPTTKSREFGLPATCPHRHEPACTTSARSRRALPGSPHPCSTSR